jgi:hypothetical protein
MIHGILFSLYGNCRVAAIKFKPWLGLFYKNGTLITVDMTEQMYSLLEVYLLELHE